MTVDYFCLLDELFNKSTVLKTQNNVSLVIASSLLLVLYHGSGVVH